MFTASHSVKKAAASRLAAKMTAAGALTAPVTRGRREVLCIRASMSRSRYMFAALAPPADRVPPMRVATTRPDDGQPRAATTMVGTVVTRSSSIMRGLVRATNAPMRASVLASERTEVERAEIVLALLTTWATLGAAGLEGQAGW